MRNPAVLVCRVFGVLFVVVGLAAFVLGEAADRYHNVLHFVTGLAALVVGFAGSRIAARAFCVAFGAGYLAFGGLGFVVGTAESGYLWDLHILHLGAGEHAFHIVLGSIVLLGGIIRASTAPDRLLAGRRGMGERTPLTRASRIVVASLVVAAVGVLTLMLAGVDFTTLIPPGLAILLLPAILVAHGRWRWAPVVAALAGLFIVVSYFPSGASAGLLDPSRRGVFTGLWLQFAASAVAVVAGVVATVRNYRRPAATLTPRAGLSTQPAPRTPRGA